VDQTSHNKLTMDVKMPAPSLSYALIVAALLVLVDAFVLGQSYLTLVSGAGVILIALPRAFLRKFRATRRARLRNIGIYLMAVVMVFVVIVANTYVASARWYRLIQTVKAFHAKTGRYPDSLDALVPDFVSAVPRAKYTLLYGDFTYTRIGTGALLYFTVTPPYGRPTYDFGAGKVGRVD
jgi:hypothetical protein